MQGPQKDGKRLAEYFKHERHYESPRLLVCPIAVSENSQVGTSQDRSSSYVIHSFLSSNCCPDLATRNSCCPPRQRLPLSPPNKLIPKDWGFVQEDEESPIIINSSKTLLSPLFLARNNKNLEGGGHLVRLASDTARLLHPPTFIASHFLYWLTSSLVLIPMSTKWWPHGFYRRRELVGVSEHINERKPKKKYKIRIKQFSSFLPRWGALCSYQWKQQPRKSNKELRHWKTKTQNGKGVIWDFLPGGSAPHPPTKEYHNVGEQKTYDPNIYSI
jgi:hypothetical protein